MSEQAPNAPPSDQRKRSNIFYGFGELGSRLVPILAIITALVFGSFFMLPASMDFEAARADNAYGREFVNALANTGTAYNALLEGATGLSFLRDDKIEQQKERTNVFTLLPLGELSLVFIPRNLTDTLVRATPFVLAGLSVALAFKTGLFNIGAEGQLYAGALLGVWVGFHPALENMPAIVYIPLVMLAGTVGGIIWGAIPGILKARTGAHEVINTIMMNAIAIRLADWLIKSKDPVILLDTESSVPRTPFIWENARYPTFGDTRLHTGIVVVILAAVFVWWLLQKTTLGFELRTVGANPNAAKYAGMSVSKSIVMAMGISGGLAGLAGVGEVMGVQHNLPPGFFMGIGFDGIAIALLARNNPFSIIPAAFLWGGLLNGAGLMQIRADLSIDLIKIIQGLIVMFVAADQIVRLLWRVRARKAGEELVFSRGWGA